MTGMRPRIARNPETGRRGTQVTRIPNFRPGTWVKIGNQASTGLAGRVMEVKALTCSVGEGRATWRIHFTDGRCVTYQQVERFATEAEIIEAKKRRSTL